MLWFYWAAGFVILVLAIVAGYYHYLLHQKNKQLRANEKSLQESFAKKRIENLRSVHIIARAVIDDQVTLTEASIRINALMPVLGLDKHVEEEFSVFRQLAEATAHIPILDKWKALPKKQKRAYDAERENIESDFRDFVVAASEKIVHQNILKL